jgi:hypothetical protein
MTVMMAVKSGVNEWGLDGKRRMREHEIEPV